MGASSHRSIGWGIARALHREGAELFFSYSSERSKTHLDDLLAALPDGGSVPRARCDVGSDADAAALFRRLGEHWGGKLDVLVHSVGHARALEVHVRYLAAELGPRNIRVNAISAGPIRTLSASAVKSLAAARRQVEERAPLRRNVDTDQIGDAALFLASDLARCLTGEILHADSGFHVLGA
jgi:enoyl-[acyl-carrier-protein] reductase (NADH)